MRILVVEDDLKTASFIINGLKESGYVVEHVINAEDAISLFEYSHYDLAVVDIMLPQMDGLSLIEKLRKKGINTPVIILSAKRTVNDRVRGLRAGGDDYITKPFSFLELSARIQAIMRRLNATTSPTRLTAGDISLDLLTREVIREGKQIELQPREFSLLEYFLRNVGIVLSKTLIMENVWNYDFDPQTSLVDVLISRLRNKIDRDFHFKMIHTIRGVGYVFKVPEDKEH